MAQRSKHSEETHDNAPLRSPEPGGPGDRGRRPSTCGPRTSYLQVLVVDDDASIRKMIVQYLERGGVSTLQAESGQQALQLAHQHAERIGAVLLDVMMPKLSGYDVLCELKSKPQTQRIPVVVLTAHANRVDDVVRALEAGAADHLEKPFQGQVLVAKMRALCAQRKRDMDVVERLKMVEAMATTDDLTELGNRRQFRLQLAMEVAFTARHRQPVSLLIFDLDRFKEINDNFGHPQGDRVLCYAAECVRQSLRVSDQGYRLGGDEFAVLLRGTDGAGGLVVAKRLIRELKRQEFVFPDDHRRRITMSVGVAAADVGNEFNLSLVERADRALYRAKRAGTDRAELEP